ncbi:hypothetical protein N7468_006783 [Penicillium chermesinum]|uniref:Uncharacterized protein n=1 Tax=Penicillium chermesinum TaxID=63820 RepID=A0A9W9TK07_9EURO|nr:uncharacterized protein N7468_006783 [Penicillium chermesinum]KAJ5225558.1 hypothetical protein N7468_006783 [Penicillium chermesinum]
MSFFSFGLAPYMEEVVPQSGRGTIFALDKTSERLAPYKTRATSLIDPLWFSSYQNNPSRSSGTEVAGDEWPRAGSGIFCSQAHGMD